MSIFGKRKIPAIGDMFYAVRDTYCLIDSQEESFWSKNFINIPLMAEIFAGSNVIILDFLDKTDVFPETKNSKLVKLLVFEKNKPERIVYWQVPVGFTGTLPENQFFSLSWYLTFDTLV